MFFDAYMSSHFHTDNVFSEMTLVFHIITAKMFTDLSDAAFLQSSPSFVLIQRARRYRIDGQ